MDVETTQLMPKLVIGKKPLKCTYINECNIHRTTNKEILNVIQEGKNYCLHPKLENPNFGRIMIVKKYELLRLTIEVKY